MPGVLTSTEIDTVLSAARFFLQGLDIERGQLVYVETSREILSSASFIDGRSPLAINERSTVVPLQQALAWYKDQQAASGCDRLIAHTAFCGSTLLARALDSEGRSFVYKEPQILIDLVTLKQGGAGLNAHTGEWSALVKLCLQQLRKSWSTGEVSIVKPSNWVNILLPELVQGSDEYKLVLLSSSVREFLLATIRGGRDRFAYVLNFLNQIQLEFPQYKRLLAALESDGDSGMVGPLKFCAIAFHMQQAVFDQVQADAEAGRVLRLSLQQLLDQPGHCAHTVADHFELATLCESRNDGFTKVFGRHSKDTEKFFDKDQAVAANSELEKQYGGELNLVIDWYKDYLAVIG